MYKLYHRTVKWGNTYDSKKEEMLHDSEVCEEQTVLGAEAQAFPNFVQIFTDVITINIHRTTGRGIQAYQR
jgi:hypothetical protein